MDELLRQSKNIPQLVPANRQLPMMNNIQQGQGNYNVGNIFNSSAPANPIPQPLTKQDTGIDPVDDAEIETDTFKNVNIDSVLHNGVSNLPPPVPRHRASSIATAYNDSPSPSPPITLNNQFSQSAPPPPPLPPKVRVESMGTNGSQHPFSNSSSTGPAPHSPLPQNHTGPGLAALVPTPTGPIAGKSNTGSNGNSIFGPFNQNGGNQQSTPGLHPNSIFDASQQSNSSTGIGGHLSQTNSPSFGLSPQPTGPMNSSSFSTGPQPLRPFPTGGPTTNEQQPPPPPASRLPFNNYLQPAATGSTKPSSPSLAQFESIFQQNTANTQSGTQAQDNGPTQVQFNSYTQNAFGQHVQQHVPQQQQQQQPLQQQHTQFQHAPLFPTTTGGSLPPQNAQPLNNYPQPPPRRSVSGGNAQTTPLQSNMTGMNMGGQNQFLMPNATGFGGSLHNGPPPASNGPVMSNGILAPPPPPSRRRQMSASIGSPNSNSQFQPIHSSSASNLHAPQTQQTGMLQQQFTGHQPMYSTPTGSNSVPNLTNGMQNLGFR